MESKSELLCQLVGDLTDAERVLIQALRDIAYGEVIVNLHSGRPIAWRRIDHKVKIRIESCHLTSER